MSNRSPKRLGRGLEALIPSVEPESEKQGESLLNIEVARIRMNPKQPRTDFDPQGLEELKQSILENGVIQPITVRPKDDGYELISGERRLRAVMELGYEKIPAYILPVESDEKMLELALVENIQREDLNPIELAKAYEKLQTEYGLTQEEVAQKVGKDRATVANFIRLLKLPEAIQESLSKGEITMGHARALMGLSSPTDQLQLWKKILAKGLNVRQVEEAVRTSMGSKPGAKKETGSHVPPFVQEIEDRIRKILGTQIKVHYSPKGGKIEIHYYSDEDLDRILELLSKIEE